MKNVNKIEDKIQGSYHEENFSVSFDIEFEKYFQESKKIIDFFKPTLIFLNQKDTFHFSK